MAVFVQHFGSAANLNVHLHIVALDGVYEEKSTGRLKFYVAPTPTVESTVALMDDIVSRINNHLIKKGHLTVEDGLPITGCCRSVVSASIR